MIHLQQGGKTETQIRYAAEYARFVEIGSLEQGQKIIGGGKFNIGRPLKLEDLSDEKPQINPERKSSNLGPIKKNAITGKGVVRLSSSLYNAKLSLSTEKGGELLWGHLVLTQSETGQVISLDLIQRRKVYLDDLFREGEQLILELEGTPALPNRADADAPTMTLYFAHGDLFFDKQLASFGSSLLICQNLEYMIDE